MAEVSSSDLLVWTSNQYINPFLCMHFADGGLVLTCMVAGLAMIVAYYFNDHLLELFQELKVRTHTLGGSIRLDLAWIVARSFDTLSPD